LSFGGNIFDEPGDGLLEVASTLGISEAAESVVINSPYY